MKSKQIALALVAILAIQGCSNTTAAKQPPPLSEADVVGKWTARISPSQAARDKAEKASADNEAQQEAVQGVSEMEFPIELKADNTFSLTLLIVEIIGTWSLEGETIQMTFEGVDNEMVAKALEQGNSGGMFGRVYSLTMSDDRMTMSGSPEGDPDTVFTFEKVVDEEEKGDIR